MKFDTALFGISLGLFISGAFSFFGENGLQKFHAEPFQRILRVSEIDNLPVPMAQARELLPQAELLGMQKSFVECFVPITILSGFLLVWLMQAWDKSAASEDLREKVPE